MSPIRLMPRDEKFGELFVADGENLRAATSELLALVNRYDDLEARVQRIRDLEHQGDVISDDLIDRLERAFITPFDREDIHALVSRVDDVVDRVQEIAETFLLYDVTAPTAGGEGARGHPRRTGGAAAGGVPSARQPGRSGADRSARRRGPGLPQRTSSSASTAGSPEPARTSRVCVSGAEARLGGRCAGHEASSRAGPPSASARRRRGAGACRGRGRWARRARRPRPRSPS